MLKIESYDQLKSISKEQAEKEAIKTIAYNGYLIYTIETEPCYGLCMLAYYKDKMVKNTSQIHYRMYDDEKANEIMFKELIKELFSLYDFYSVSNYSDYFNKLMAIINVIPKRYESESIYGNNKKGYRYCYGCNLYKNEEDAVEVLDLHNVLEKVHQQKMENDIEYFKSAVEFELANHEACITYSASEGLAALGLRYRDLSKERQSIVTGILNDQIRRYENDGYLD